VTIPRTPDALVIGGGVIGCAVARELAGTGRRVVLVDRGAIGGEASSAAAGVLAVASGDDDGARLALRHGSLARHAELATALRDEVGVDVGFERCGVVEPAFTEEALAAQAARIGKRRAQGLRVEACDARGLRALEPTVSGDARGAVVFPDDAMVVADRFVMALAASARHRGAVVVPGTHVSAVERAGDRIGRVRAGETWITPELVVLASGAWSDGAVEGLATGVRIVPVRGQMMAIRPPRLPRRVVRAGTAFLVPRAHGEVWVGATFEEAGFVKAVTPEGLRTLAAHVERLAPEMAAAPVLRMWSGLRPSCPAGGPVLGRPRGLANVLVALGHHRNGILLAPTTARAIRAEAEGTPVPDEARPFGLG
jgi:glycine oxidase